MFVGKNALAFAAAKPSTEFGSDSIEPPGASQCGRNDDRLWQECSGKQSRSFTLRRVVPAAFFFPQQFAIVPDFENPAAAADQANFFVSHLFDFSRHTVGFGAVISLFAIFDLNHAAVTRT